MNGHISSTFFELMDLFWGFSSSLKQQEKGTQFKKDIFNASQSLLLLSQGQTTTCQTTTDPTTTCNTDGHDQTTNPVSDIFKIEGEYVITSIITQQQQNNESGEEEEKGREERKRERRVEVEVWVKMFNKGKLDSQIMLLNHLHSQSSYPPFLMVFSIPFPFLYYFFFFSFPFY